MSIRQLLEEHNLEPRKSLGQNFMISEGALNALADAAQLAPGDVALEVGAGLGHLTAVLAQRVGAEGRVIAVEMDQQMMPVLRMQMAAYPQVELVLGDMLELTPGDLTSGAAYAVAANVPYYITSALVRHFLESDHPPLRLAVTVQREVADRMVAEPGDMSLLAVSVQLYGKPKRVKRLKAGVFYPPPKIESAIVRIVPHAEPLLPAAQRDAFFAVARAAFGQKRKQIKNSLQSGLSLSSEQVVACLETANIDPRRRAETLSIDEWLALHRAFAAAEG